MNTSNNDMSFTFAANVDNLMISNSAYSVSSLQTNGLLVYAGNNKEIIKIDGDGRIFWEGREVTTDEDYREAMMVLMKRLTTPW